MQKLSKSDVLAPALLVQNIKAIKQYQLEILWNSDQNSNWKIIGKLFYPIGCDFLDIIVIESAHDEIIVG